MILNIPEADPTANNSLNRGLEGNVLAAMAHVSTEPRTASELAYKL